MASGNSERKQHKAISNVNVRRANSTDVDAIAKVHVGTWRTAYKEILSADFLSNLSIDRSRATLERFLLDQKTHALYVAEDGSKHIVGFVSCGPNRDNDPTYAGEVYAMYVLQEMQRQGIGRQLIRSAVTDLRSRGFNSMIVWVLADNPSRQFYKKLGGEQVQKRKITLGGSQFEEYGYGWKDLNLIPST